MKYIVYDHWKVILFSEHLPHAEVDRVLRENFKDLRRPTSAGFCSIENGKVKVFGKSESMNLSSRPDDIEIIEHAIQTTYNK
jgi:hypothetical protein